MTHVRTHDSSTYEIPVPAGLCASMNKNYARVAPQMQVRPGSVRPGPQAVRWPRQESNGRLSDAEWSCRERFLWRDILPGPPQNPESRAPQSHIVVSRIILPFCRQGAGQRDSGSGMKLPASGGDGTEPWADLHASDPPVAAGAARGMRFLAVSAPVAGHPGGQVPRSSSPERPGSIPARCAVTRRANPGVSPVYLAGFFFRFEGPLRDCRSFSRRA